MLSVDGAVVPPVLVAPADCGGIELGPTPPVLAVPDAPPNGTSLGSEVPPLPAIADGGGNEPLVCVDEVLEATVGASQFSKARLAASQ
jgi:hypothetical protein